MLIRVALKSIQTRKLAVFFIALALALSLSTLLLTRSLSEELKTSFNSSVSGTDLIVGARANPLQIVLYSVFRIGTPTQAISAERAEQVRHLPQVKWSFPIVLGDSHRGFTVLGTDNQYFNHFRYGRKQALNAAQGELGFNHPLQVVIGADVAKKLHYELGDFLMLSHGSHQHSFHHHDDVHFQISGILAPTGTPVDKTIHVHLAALEAIHAPTFQQRLTRKTSAHSIDHDHHQADDHKHQHKHHSHHPLHIPHSENAALADLSFADLPQPTVISALFLGLTNRVLTFQVQASINAAHSEPLTAVLPGMALAEFWQLLGNVEVFLNALSILMLVAALLGSVAMLQLSLTIRQQEIGLLRLIGARPWQLALLLELEILVIMLLSWLLALVIASLGMLATQLVIATYSGLQIQANLNVANIGLYFGASLLLALIAGLIPAWSSYKLSLKSSL